MARFKLLLILLPLLLAQSCAEIVPLTGGPEDDIAPRVGYQQPEQGMTYYTGNSVVVVFDEYVKLNDPNTTISINPSNVKVNSELKGRTLTLSWDGALAANTTYIIQLNGTVRDINEANDSIMQFVFSTGAIIDSLSFSGKAAGAFSNAAQAQLTVGLYPPDSNPLQSKPVYATRTDAQGEFKFNYLKAENYQLFAFQDGNKDQKVQAVESIAFLDTTVTPGDTNAAVLHVFPQIPVREILRTTFVAPGMVVVHNYDSLDASRLTINGEAAEILQAYSGDSIAFALPANTSSNYVFGYDTLNFSKPFTVSERTVPLLISAEGRAGKWKPGDSLSFRINDRITGFDTSMITLVSTKGATIPYTFLQQRKNSLTLVPDPKTTDPFTVKFGKNALQGSTLKTDTTKFAYATLLTADLSNLTLNCSNLEGQWVIELTQNDRMLYSKIKLAGDSTVVFEQIEPGQYNARCIADVNKNGKWDTGNFEAKQQPEEIKRFTLTQKLRPNWDVEETLLPKTTP